MVLQKTCRKDQICLQFCLEYCGSESAEAGSKLVVLKLDEFLGKLGINPLTNEVLDLQRTWWQHAEALMTLSLS
jgi:hypothetical protein